MGTRSFVPVRGASVRHIIIDYYPEEDAFYPHIAAPTYERDPVHDRIRAQYEDLKSRKLMDRIVKHLRRVHLTDKRHPAEWGGKAGATARRDLAREQLKLSRKIQRDAEETVKESGA